jgi:hypothetical protein
MYIASLTSASSQAQGRLSTLHTELPQLLAQPTLVRPLEQHIVGETLLLGLGDDGRSAVGEGEPQPLHRPLEAGFVEGQQHLRVGLQVISWHASPCPTVLAL